MAASVISTATDYKDLLLKIKNNVESDLGASAISEYSTGIATVGYGSEDYLYLRFKSWDNTISTDDFFVNIRTVSNGTKRGLEIRGCLGYNNALTAGDARFSGQNFTSPNVFLILWNSGAMDYAITTDNFGINLNVKVGTTYHQLVAELLKPNISNPDEYRFPFFIGADSSTLVDYTFSNSAYRTCNDAGINTAFYMLPNSTTWRGIYNHDINGTVEDRIVNSNTGSTTQGGLFNYVTGVDNIYPSTRAWQAPYSQGRTGTNTAVTITMDNMMLYCRSTPTSTASLIIPMFPIVIQDKSHNICSLEMQHLLALGAGSEVNPETILTYNSKNYRVSTSINRTSNNNKFAMRIYP